MNLNDLLIGGLSIVALVIGLVEACKKNFGIEGKWAFILALIFGVVLSVLAEIAVQVPAASVWIVRVVQGLGAALAATGWYDLSQNLAKPRE